MKNGLAHLEKLCETTQVNEGMLLTLSDFIILEEMEMKDEYDEQSLFQLSFCLDGKADWTYQSDVGVSMFHIGA